MNSQTHRIACNLIDICYPDYLTDHHNRDNEVLISCWVFEGMDTDHIVECLMESVDRCIADKLPMKFKDEEIETAIYSEVNRIVSRDFGLRLFLESDESSDESEISEVYLFAYLSW